MPQGIPVIKQKDNTPQKRKYPKIVTLIRYLYLEYIKKTYNSVGKRQIIHFKHGQRLNNYFSKDNRQMANKHMERCFLSSAAWETTARYFFTSTRVTTIKKTDNNKYWQGVEKREPSCAAAGNVKRCSQCGKYCGSSLKKVKCKIKYHMSQQFIPRYVTKTLCPQQKHYVHKKSCM